MKVSLKIHWSLQNKRNNLKMSSICQSFVENAWRKDICSNCFRVRDEHSAEITNSVKCAAAADSNGVNTIVPHISKNETNGILLNANDEGRSSHHWATNKFLRLQTPTSTSTFSQSQGPTSTSSIPRISNGNVVNGSVGAATAKFSGTNPSSTTTKGLVHSTFNGSRNSIHNSGSNLNENNEPETGKVKSSAEAISKSLSSSSIFTSNQLHQTHLITSQGKGVMTNQHPSKNDNSGVIPPSNHHSNRQPMTSSALPNHQQLSSTGTTGRVSSFIASKNIFNNANTTSMAGSSASSHLDTTGFASTVNTATSATSGGTTSTTNPTNCINGAVSLAVAGAGSSNLSHPQSVNSIKRVSTVPASSSIQPSTQQSQPSHKTCGVGGFDVVTCSSGPHHGRHLEVKNGGIETQKKEIVGATNNISNICVSGGSKKEYQIGMHRGKGASDGDSFDRRKVAFSTAMSGTSDGSESVMRGGKSVKKGILRNNGSRKRDKNVRFPEEVVEVIGYGGGPSGTSDDEDDSPTDPLDNASVSEVIEKSSTTMEEKELHRLTQKNTNFNSIKTNLLGTTCIEIGPIVGCTGGKSMEGSSKPLVSIGTFEARKEPLRIAKKISEDSADDELNEKTVEKHRKFIQKNTSGGSPTGKTLLPTSTSSVSSRIASKEESKQPAMPLKSSLKNTSHSTATTAIKTPPKTSSSTSSLSTPLSPTSRGSGASTTTIEVNPEQQNALRGSKESVKSGGISGTVASRISAVTANKWGGGTTSSIPTTANSSVSSNESNLRNPKPVLKRLQQKNATDSSPSSPDGSSSSSYTVNAAVVETNKSPTSPTRGNLVILTSPTNKVGSSASESIASKRNSFLRDIIVDSSTSTLLEPTKNSDSSSSTNGGVQVICKNGINGKPEQKPDLKLDLKPNVTNGKLSHPPFGECLSNRSNGTDDSSEFDDSLEDSGLDIKKCSEISESDEKSGSGSDSGNENDYSERERVKIISTTGPKSLFISVDEVEGQNKKPEKLSPDSVLFSSASEMSASGSSESIPEALDTLSNGSSQKSSVSSSTSGNESGSSGNSAAINVKRAAPRPPSSSVPEVSKGIYANGQTQSSIVEVESLYDDVSFYKNPMHFDPKKVKIPAFEEEDEENLYDDCNTITAIPQTSKSGKSATGSYNFQNGAHNTLDSDGDDEAEKVVTRRSDGIEFIGIRKIDSESFLRERSPTPERNPDGKRERSSSASPKTRRKVNQFFSTIGKKAGAAFSNHVHGYGKNKSTPVIEEAGIEKSPSGNSSAYKRSLSTDEVSMTRTQELYATLTPTSLKFKGLAPVLHKLSKMDLMGDKDKSASGDLDDDSKEKGYKKHKISSSIKKFLRFGSKEGEASGYKYDFGNCPNKTDISGPSQMITSQISEEVMTDNLLSRTPTPTSAAARAVQAIKPERKGSAGTISGRPPPPPPPRVHSLDLLNRVGVVGPNGTVRPARPPPPTRNNRVAPSFTSVFNNPNGSTERMNDGTTTIIINGNAPSELPDPNNPPSKPKRKASINLECVTNGISRDLETTYNHITTLNQETLKIIASQTPTKIRRSVSFTKHNNSPLRFSQFHIADPSKPLINGNGFVFYAASLDDESCVLLVQESATAPHFSAPFEFPCVETSITFEDYVPSSFITWKASEYVTAGNNVKVFVSVMPKYSMYTVESYMRQSQVPLLHKYFALLQAMNYWDKEDMSDLLVLVQSMDETDNHNRSSSEFQSPSSVLVYVHPIPHLSNQSRLSGMRTLSRTQLSTDFENSMKQILLSSGADWSSPLLGNNDRQVLLRRLNENKSKTVQEQVRLFLQVKLFTPKRDSEELERIKKLRSERAIQQWLDKERALCMKEAVEQTLQRNVESSISPYKRSYLEFLLTPENSAKAVLDMLIDLLE